MVILAYDGLDFFNIQLKDGTVDVHRAYLIVDLIRLQPMATHEMVKPTIGEGEGCVVYDQLGHLLNLRLSRSTKGMTNDSVILLLDIVNLLDENVF